MADVLGDISLDAGYAEALIIIGNRTVKGVGGGVCQVSTTLFRAAFFGGYQIDERYPHAYRVRLLRAGPELPRPRPGRHRLRPAGRLQVHQRHAALAADGDLPLRQPLEWKFYSAKDGRVVSWETSRGAQRGRGARAAYKENDDLSKGKIKQVDYEADGADVTVTARSLRDGQVLHNDVIRTHYLPWRAIYEYGPGTELPEGAETED